MQFIFNVVGLCVVTINENPWVCTREVCRALKYNKNTVNIVKNHCSKENYAQKYQMSGVTAVVTPVDWPKDSQKFDIYINQEGMYELLFSSQQPKAKDFRRHCCNVMLPQFRQQLSDKLHAMKIEDLTNLVQAQEKARPINMKISRLNEEHRQSLEEKANRYAARRECFENVLCFIKKNSGEVYPYYVIRCQYSSLTNISNA